MKRVIINYILFSSIIFVTGCLPGVLTDDGRGSSGVFIEDFTLTEATEDGECDSCAAKVKRRVL